MAKKKQLHISDGISHAQGPYKCKVCGKLYGRAEKEEACEGKQ